LLGRTGSMDPDPELNLWEGIQSCSYRAILFLGGALGPPFSASFTWSLGNIGLVIFSSSFAPLIFHFFLLYTNILILSANSQQYPNTILFKQDSLYKKKYAYLDSKLKSLIKKTVGHPESNIFLFLLKKCFLNLLYCTSTQIST
jgi:hypothetical protein